MEAQEMSPFRMVMVVMNVCSAHWVRSVRPMRSWTYR